MTLDDEKVNIFTRKVYVTSLIVCYLILEILATPTSPAHKPHCLIKLHKVTKKTSQMLDLEKL